MSEEIKHCEPDNPNRCQGIVSSGQCTNLAVEGFPLCKSCGRAQEANATKTKYHNYLLRQSMSRVSDFAGGEHVKSLRDEVGILRMIIEQVLNKCDQPMDVILHSSTLTDLISKVERVVNTMHKLEGSMGQLLDKQALLQFANEIISILISEIENEELITKISNRIINALGDDKES